MKILFAILAFLCNAAFKAGIIQENIFRNRKLGADPAAKKWHWWQSFQYVAVIAVEFFGASLYAGRWCWEVLLIEIPLGAAFWILFQGFNNIRTFKRAWWYVGNLVTRKSEGSQMDQFFLTHFDNPVKAMKIAQFSFLGLSFLPLVLYILL